MPRSVRRRERKIEGDVITLFIVRAINSKGKVLGYIGRKYSEKQSEKKREASKFSYVLCPDIISPERRFIRKGQEITDEQQKSDQDKLKRHLARENIEPADAHRCTLKYRRRSDARRLLADLPLRNRRKYEVVKIQLFWGKPHTARLLSN